MNVSTLSNRRPVSFPVNAPQATTQSPALQKSQSAQPTSQALKSYNTDSFDTQRSTPSDVSQANTSTQALIQGASSSDVFPVLGEHTQQGLGAQKQAVWNAALEMGASKETAGLLVAQLMQEGFRDFTKDNDGASANFGPFNLNKDMLTTFGGVKPEELSKLNEGTPEAVRANVKAAITAIKNMGADRYLDHVRGGATGYNNPSPDEDRFVSTLATAAKRVVEHESQDKNWMSSDSRDASDIAHK